MQPAVILGTLLCDYL